MSSLYFDFSGAQFRRATVDSVRRTTATGRHQQRRVAEEVKPAVAHVADDFVELLIGNRAGSDDARAEPVQDG